MPQSKFSNDLSVRPNNDVNFQRNGFGFVSHFTTQPSFIDFDTVSENTGARIQKTISNIFTEQIYNQLVLNIQLLYRTEACTINRDPTEDNDVWFVYANPALLHLASPHIFHNFFT